MQALLKACDGYQARLELLPDTVDEASWLAALEQGLLHAFDAVLRPLINEALSTADWAAYRMQSYQGRSGTCYLFAVGPAPRPAASA